MTLSEQRHLHRAACVVGGFAAMYTVLVRVNLGSSQTLNLLEVLKNILGRSFFEAALHLLGALIYGGAVFGVVVMTKRTHFDMKLVSMAINIVGFVVLAILPKDIPAVVGLYPTFIMMSVQWVVFGSLGGYSSSPIFSTNNFRQAVGALAEYVCDRNPEQLEKAKHFGYSLLFFHIGAAVSYFLVTAFDIKAALFGIIPCMVVCVMEIIPKHELLRRAAERS